MKQHLPAGAQSVATMKSYRSRRRTACGAQSAFGKSHFPCDGRHASAPGNRSIVSGRSVAE